MRLGEYCCPRSSEILTIEIYAVHNMKTEQIVDHNLFSCSWELDDAVSNDWTGIFSLAFQ